MDLRRRRQRGKSRKTGACWAVAFERSAHRRSADIPEAHPTASCWSVLGFWRNGRWYHVLVSWRWHHVSPTSKRWQVCEYFGASIWDQSMKKVQYVKNKADQLSLVTSSSHPLHLFVLKYGRSTWLFQQSSNCAQLIYMDVILRSVNECLLSLKKKAPLRL